MKKIIVLVACLAAIVSQTAPAATKAQPPLVPNAYAFPPSWVAIKQKQVRVYWPGAFCRGRGAVPLVGGKTGWRFIECVDELDNPPTRIWFRITSSGRVVMDITAIG